MEDSGYKINFWTITNTKPLLLISETAELPPHLGLPLERLPSNPVSSYFKMTWMKYDQFKKKEKEKKIKLLPDIVYSLGFLWAMSKISWTWCVWKGEWWKGLNVQWGVKKIGSIWQIWICGLWIDSNGNGGGFVCGIFLIIFLSVNTGDYIQKKNL